MFIGPDVEKFRPSARRAMFIGPDVEMFRPSARRAMFLLIGEELEDIFGFVSNIELLQ